MRAKNIALVFFLAIVSLLLLASVSAAEITSDSYVEVNEIAVTSNPSVVAGESITVKIYFTSLVNDTNVVVEAEIEGDKATTKATSKVFDVEADHKYKKVLILEVPYELKDEVSDTVTLNIEIDGSKHKTELADIDLTVQRPSYNVDIMSINMPQSVEAGDLVAIDVVFKNTGYNDLDDLYLTASFPALNVEKTTYIGDLVSIESEDDDDEEDTTEARAYLKVPYDAPAGLYALEVEIRNSDLTVSETKEVEIKNDFSSNVIVNEYRKSFGVGETGEYKVLIVNPTDKVKAYRVVANSDGNVYTSASESIVAVQPGSSKEVTVSATSTNAGEYQFDITVFSGEDVVGQATLTANVHGGAAAADAIVVLTVILVIIFLVLLIVLVVLLRKKPEKAEEFGESYY